MPFGGVPHFLNRKKMEHLKQSIYNCICRNAKGLWTLFVASLVLGATSGTLGLWVSFAATATHLVARVFAMFVIGFYMLPVGTLIVIGGGYLALGAIMHAILLAGKIMGGKNG